MPEVAGTQVEDSKNILWKARDGNTILTQPPAAETSDWAGMASIKGAHWTLTQSVVDLTVFTEHFLWARGAWAALAVASSRSRTVGDKDITLAPISL